MTEECQNICKAMAKEVESYIQNLKLPTRPNPPHEYVQFVNMSKQDKERIREKGSFFKLDYIKNYLDTMERLEGFRRDLIHELKTLLEFMEPKFKTIAISKITDFKKERYYIFGQGPVINRTQIYDSKTSVDWSQ